MADSRLPMIAWCFCGSFCTLDKGIRAAGEISVKYGPLLTVISESVQTTDTRFGKAEDFLERIKNFSEGDPIRCIRDAEPIGPVRKPQAMIIAPCTGNTLAKLANGIIDSAVTMAAKAHLRNSRPLILALATNDALSSNLRNIGILLERKNVYFVPLGQDDPVKKPTSLICDFTKIERTLEDALDGRQTEPLLIDPTFR